jgi:hypothetical protein
MTARIIAVGAARSALRIPLALWERAGVGETALVTATYMREGGAGTTTVSKQLNVRVRR